MEEENGEGEMRGEKCDVIYQSSSGALSTRSAPFATDS